MDRPRSEYLLAIALVCGGALAFAFILLVAGIRDKPGTVQTPDFKPSFFTSDDSEGRTRYTRCGSDGWCVTSYHRVDVEDVNAAVGKPGHRSSSVPTVDIAALCQSLQGIPSNVCLDLR